jgi:hypothetical protein
MSISVVAYTKDSTLTIETSGISQATYGYNINYIASGQTWNLSTANRCLWGINATLRRGGNPVDNSYIQCENLTAGRPNGELCKTGLNLSFSNTILSTSFVMREFNFSTCGSITTLTEYAITARRTGALSTVDYMQFEQSSASSYSGGEAMVLNTGASPNWQFIGAIFDNVIILYFQSTSAGVNSSVTTTPILSDITGTQTTLFYTNITNYQNNTANQRIVWTVNSTSGIILKNATNATGRFLNCSSYPQCKGGSTIYARGITEKGVSKSSYSAAKSVYIFPDFVRVDFTNLTYLPLNNSWHDGSFNMYFKPVSNSNPMNCTLFKNATLNTVKENLTANVTTFFLIGTNAGELSNNSYYIVCAAAKEYASGIMTGTSNSKTMLVDMVNPIINIWTPSADLQRFYQTININVTIQNFLINNVYMKVYDSASTLTYDYTSNYGIYLKNYLKSYVMSNFTGSKHEGFVQIYARDYVNKTSNYTRHFYVMNCTQLSESWSTNYLQPCQITDTRTYNYADANSCNTYIDNVTNVNQVINGSCNYCTSTYSYIDSACSNGIFQRTYSYTNPCCSITSLSSDCNIPSNQNYSCSIPVNIVGLGVKEVLGETGHGLGSFASGMMSGGGIVKLIMGVLIIVAMVALVLGVAYVAKESIRKL